LPLTGALQEKTNGPNFLQSQFGGIRANLASCNNQQSYGQINVTVGFSSLGQKGLELTLAGVLIVIEGCFTIAVNGAGSQFTLRISNQIVTKCRPKYHTNVTEHIEPFVIRSIAKLFLLDLELVVLPPLDLRFISHVASA